MRPIDADILLSDLKEYFDLRGCFSTAGRTEVTLSDMAHVIQKQRTLDQDAYSYDVLDTLSAAWNGKQTYFLENDGTVYSRLSGSCLPSVSAAVRQFAHVLDDDLDDDINNTEE